MNINYVHTLGDSTLDNHYWMLNKEKDTTKAKDDSVEGQLQKKLNEDLDSNYQVISHAYDGFTTSSVLKGDHVGRVLNMYPGSWKTEVKEAYLNGRNISLSDKSYFVHPLNDLKDKVAENAKDNHFVVISVGGNDFRERLGNPIALLKDIPLVHERYLRILKEIKSLKDKNVKPILMFQYRLDAHHDHYCIYMIMKAVGSIFATFNSLNVLGIGWSALSMMTNKISHSTGVIFILMGVTLLTLSNQILPLKVTKNILYDKQEVAMATLCGLLETVYRPMLAQAQADGIPILDLPNTFNPNDSDLYISQIEPSEKGGELIARGIDHIIKNHDFSSKSKIYSKKFSEEQFTHTENRGPRYWSVAYPFE